MADPRFRTIKEISDINCLCLRAHRVLNNLGMNNVLQRRILGGLSDDEFRSILYNRAGKTLQDIAVKRIKIFYEDIYLMSKTIAPEGKDITECWLNRNGDHPFTKYKPIHYLIQNEHSGLYTVAEHILTKRLLILAENWGLDKQQMSDLNHIMDDETVEQLLFIGKALEVLFDTPQKRAEWMQKAHSDFEDLSPLTILGRATKKDIALVFTYLYQASNGAKSWIPKFDYNTQENVISRHPNQMKFSLRN